jgi:hypothetical protein
VGWYRHFLESTEEIRKAVDRKGGVVIEIIPVSVLAAV